MVNPDLSLSAILHYAKKDDQIKEKKSLKNFYSSGNAFRKSYNNKKTVIDQIFGIEIFSSKDENKDDKEIIDTSIKMLKTIRI